MNALSSSGQIDTTLSLSHATRTPVFVEDTETAIYLENLFPELLTIAEFDVASGYFGVLSRIQDFELKHPGIKAFGIRDRDYRDCDTAKTDIPAKRNFLLDRFEIENYALEFEAIAAYAHDRLGKNISVDEISAFAEVYCSDIHYAVAYNKIISDLDVRMNRNVPEAARIYPKRYSSLSADERSHTVDSIDAGNLRFGDSSFAKLIENDDARKELCEASIGRFQRVADEYGAMLTTGLWKVRFPGKEILSAIKCNLLDLPAKDQTLLRFVAEWQQSHSKRPEDLCRLMSRLFPGS